MKKFLVIIFLIIAANAAKAQTATDTLYKGTVTVDADDRLELLGRKMAEYNEGLARAVRSARGYRLMLLSTNDRNLAMQVRSQLLQQFPDQKVYMAFQSPYIKLKFGNFQDKGEAEKFRKQIINQRIVTGNIYVLPETIEVKPEKTPVTD
ncbi:MAG: hypothetical protein JWQ27_1143 [Ferruginibacter sp.]|nr:hypothetical protein [Ferruginibacter sp.]